MIKIINVDHRGRGLRIEFLCGRRALADYEFKNHLVNRLSAELTVGSPEIERAVDRLRQEMEHEARELLLGADLHKEMRIVCKVFTERDRREINWLSKSLISQSGVVVLLGVAGEKSHILFARSQDLDRDMRLLLKTALRVLGSTTGGGRPEMAQGGGPVADEKRVEQAIDRAKRLLLAQKS